MVKIKSIEIKPIALENNSSNALDFPKSTEFTSIKNEVTKKAIINNNNNKQRLVPKRKSSLH